MDSEMEEVEVKTCDFVFAKDEEEQEAEVSTLKARVEQLEGEVESLKSDLRLIRRKLRTLDPNGNEHQRVIEKTLLSILDDQDWKISRLRKAKYDGFEYHQSNRKRAHEKNVAVMTYVPPSTRSKKEKLAEMLLSDSDSEEEEEEEVNYVDPNDALWTGEDSDTENVKPRLGKSGIYSARSKKHEMKQARTPSKPNIQYMRSSRNSSKSKPIVAVTVEKMKTEEIYPESGEIDDEEVRGYSQSIPNESGQYTTNGILSAGDRDRVIIDGDVSVILEEDSDNQNSDDNSKKKRRRNSGEAGGRPKSFRPKKLKCSICPKMFRDNHEIRRHELTHTGKLFSTYPRAEHV